MTTFFDDTAEHLREFLFAMLESMPGGVLLAEPGGMLVAANQKARQMLHLAGSSIQNRNCWEVLRRELGVTAPELAPLGRAGGSVLVAHRDPAGQGLAHLLLSRNDLQSPFLHVGGFFLLIEDVTYPAMVEAQFDRRKRFRAMQDMAESMSQELKNPLGSLELLASLLQRDLAVDPDYQRLTTQMLNAVRTMSHLLDNHLTFARLPKPARREFSVEQVIRAVIDKLLLLGREQGVSFEAGMQHHLDSFYGDAELFGQLLLNLGINAMESMPQGGMVYLGTRTLPPDRHHPPLLEIHCRDAGVGIPAADQVRIFDPFFTTKGGSRGLGLAIVHHIAEAHGGVVRVESEAGKGALFTVLLPYNQGAVFREPPHMRHNHA
ncbi:MAG: ATP-binding protein [Thermodesulfobacteriota bacterium]